MIERKTALQTRGGISHTWLKSCFSYGDSIRGLSTLAIDKYSACVSGITNCFSHRCLFQTHTADQNVWLHKKITDKLTNSGLPIRDCFFFFQMDHPYYGMLLRFRKWCTHRLPPAQLHG